jgi:hypothetical protein
MERILVVNVRLELYSVSNDDCQHNQRITPVVYEAVKLNT